MKKTTIFLCIVLTVSIFSVNATEIFNIPHIAGDDWKTTVTVFNDADTSQAITFYHWDDAGILTETTVHSVNGHSSMVLSAANFGKTGVARVEVSDDALVKVKLSYQFIQGGESESLCEFFIEKSKKSTDWFLPNPYQSHFDWLGIACANQGSATVTINFIAYKDGVEKATRTASIEPNKKGVGLSSDFWSGLNYGDIDMILIHSDLEISAPLAIIGNSEQSRHVFFPGTTIPTSGSAYTYYIPHIPDGDWETTLSVYNPTKDNAMFSFQQYDDNGDAIGIGISWGVNSYTVHDFSNLPGNFQKGGVAVVQSNTPLIFKLSYRYGESESICDFILNTDLSKRWILPNTITTWFDWFGLAVANFNGVDIEVILTAYKNGSVVGTETRTINTNKKLVDLSNNIWNTAAKSSVGSNDVDLVVIESDSPIPNPLSITGNQEQTRHVFFKGEKMGTNINIPDASFKSFLVQNYDTNGDGEINYAEAAVVDYIDTPGDYDAIGSIINLEGIQYFINVSYLKCSYELIASIPNLSTLKKLQTLIISDNPFTVLPDLSGLTSLDTLFIQTNKLEHMPKLPVSLEKLEFSSGEVTSIDLSGLVNLKYFTGDYNHIETISAIGLNNLCTLKLSHNDALTSANISSCNVLVVVDLDYCGLTGSLVIENCPVLTSVYVSENKLTSLDVSTLSSLIRLNCQLNQLTSLTITPSDKINALYISYNPLTTFDLTGFSGLQEFSAANTELTTLDASNLVNLVKLFINDSKLTSLSVVGCVVLEELYCPYNYMDDIPDVTSCTALKKFNCYMNNFDTDDCPLIKQIEAMGLDVFNYSNQRNNSNLVCP